MNVNPMKQNAKQENQKEDGQDGGVLDELEMRDDDSEDFDFEHRMSSYHPQGSVYSRRSTFVKKDTVVKMGTMKQVPKSYSTLNQIDEEPLPEPPKTDRNPFQNKVEEKKQV